MEKEIKSYIGFSKSMVDLQVQLHVFAKISAMLFKRKISFNKYFRILKRLLFFLSKMKHNKYVKIGNDIKMNLYVPAYPSKAFFFACEKMFEFDKKMPCITALVSVTSACKYSCSHCYQKHDHGKDADLAVLIQTAKKMQDMGIAFFNIEGGEPFLVYDRLLELCRNIDHRSEIVINTTGDGVSLQRLQELKSLGNVTALMFSLHSDTAEGLNAFTGTSKAWENMEKAIEMAHNVGLGVMFNSCLQHEAFTNGTFEKVMDVAKNHKAALIQLIKPKPAGGWLEKGAKSFSDKDVEILRNKVDAYNLEAKYRNYPFVYSQLLEEEVDMFGCTAGGTDRFYINAKGDLQPCEFLNISFGNIHTDDFDSIYSAMRKVFEHPGDCKLCEKHSEEILKIYKEENLKSLPLDKELSKRIYANWDQGESPDFYKKIVDL